MSAWLFDTFIWTGAAMALVLLLRRPVARHFGPQVAYALWALPLARLLLPPFVLPARFAPQAIVEAGNGSMQPAMVLVSDAVPAAGPAAVASSFPWVEMVVALWVVGAFAFLAFRVHQYRAMRHDLLADARPVGEASPVRLVETPAVDAPVAFGVRDKVVALPPLFMAHPDVAARDLAIAHELAHHRGNDLLANMAAQLLLALHWFNPVAWTAWRAMRRDQEAACDARVVAGCARSERVVYASVIAGFATGKHLALAAPMACPVLGEKSIIHRLRTLTMSDVSAVRRKFGLAAIATTALVALPLTASISYAQPDEPPVEPEVPAATPQRVIVIEHGPNAQGHEEGTVQRRVIIRRGEHDTATAGAEVDQDVAQAMAEARDAMAEAGAAAQEGRAAAAEGRRRAVEQALADMPRFAMNCDGDSPVQQRLTEDGRQLTIICRRAITSSAVDGLREAQRAIREAEGLSPAQREQIIEDLEQQIERMEGEEVAVSFSVPVIDHAAFAVAAVQPVVNVRWDTTPLAEPEMPMPSAAAVRVSAVYVTAKKHPVPLGSS
jgi:bla regulator protein BlaR1